MKTTDKPKPLTARERQQLATLQRKWATQRASPREIDRCQWLERLDRLTKATS